MTNTLILANAPKQEALICQSEAKQHFLNTPVLIDLIIEEEIKIEHAQEIKRRCVLSYSGQKVWIVAAHTFNVFAQNALLKTLEEPPKDTLFILIAKHKHALLPTILSRLVCQDKRTKTPKEPFKLDLATCTLQDIYLYLKEIDRQNLSREDVAMQIQALLYAIQKAKIPLDAMMLENFDAAMHANSLYLRPSYNLLPLLLMVLKARG